MFSNIPYIIINILLSIMLAASFIGVFYFTYAKTVEKQIIVNNVQYTIDQFTNNIIPALSSDDRINIIKYIDSLPPASTSDDNDTIVSDKKLEVTAFQYITLLIFIILTIVVIILLFNIDYNILELVVENALLLVCIGSVEYIFLTFFIAKYISSNPTQIVSSIYSQILNVIS